MSLKVGLESYQVMAKHGYYDFEHLNDQPFVFSVSATIEEFRVGEILENTLDYATIQTVIDEEILDSATPILLMETMAEKIITRLSQNELVSSITVRIEKPQAPLPHPGGLPYIEVTWTK